SASAPERTLAGKASAPRRAPPSGGAAMSTLGKIACPRPSPSSPPSPRTSAIAPARTPGATPSRAGDGRPQSPQPRGDIFTDQLRGHFHWTATRFVAAERTRTVPSHVGFPSRVPGVGGLCADVLTRTDENPLDRSLGRP